MESSMKLRSYIRKAFILGMIFLGACSRGGTAEGGGENGDGSAVAEKPRNGDIIELVLIRSYTKDEVEEAVTPFFGDYRHRPMKYGVRYYKLRYASSDYDMSGAEITAQLFIPESEVQVESPMYVFGSGTTGISDTCAPSLEQPEVRRWGWYKQNMLAYAGLGFTAVIPDYLGFNDIARPQRYFSKEAEAHVMLDAVRAVSQFYTVADTGVPGVELDGRVFAAGYSQGGHAAFAAADLQPEYAPEITLTGLIGYGSTNDIEALFREGVCYAPDIIYTFMKMYGTDTLDPADYLNPVYVDSFEEDTSYQCVDQFQKYYGFDAKHLFNADFYEALFGGTVESGYPVLYDYIKKNNTGLTGHGLPALIIQGEKDFIVTSETQTVFVDGLRAKGSEVSYHILEGVTHKYTRMAGFSYSVDWMTGF